MKAPMMLHRLAQDQAKNQRRPGPIDVDHHEADKAKQQGNPHVEHRVGSRVPAQKDKHHNAWDEEGTAHVGKPGELVEKQKAKRHRDNVRNHNEPNERERQAQVRRKHTWTRH